MPLAEVAGLAETERLAHRAPHAVGGDDVAGGDGFVAVDADVDVVAARGDRAVEAVALDDGGAGLDGDVDEGVVELQAGGDGGVRAGSGRQRHAHLAARRRAQHGAVDDLPVGDRRRVEAEQLELAQGERGQPVAAALVAGEHRLVDDDDVRPAAASGTAAATPAGPAPTISTSATNIAEQATARPSECAPSECWMRGRRSPDTRMCRNDVELAEYGAAHDETV